MTEEIPVNLEQTTQHPSGKNIYEQLSNAPETSRRPKLRPKDLNVKKKDLKVQKFSHGGMTTPDKPRGCGAAQTSGFRGGETY